MNKNKDLLNSFVEYCYKNPELRFWQALVGWSGFSKIIAETYNWTEKGGEEIKQQDTFYWEGING